MTSVYYPVPTDRRIHLIGMVGKAGSGKNYLAKHALLPAGYVPLALANHFKVDAVVRDGAPIDEVFFTQKSDETRALLQRRGTEEGRHVYGEDIWIRTLEAWIAAFVASGSTRFVITDVRFPNEADWVRQMGGKLVRVTGRGGLSGALSFHPSETALDDYPGAFDLTLDNSPAQGPYAVNALQQFAVNNHFIGK
jgi:hypothetical protein